MKEQKINFYQIQKIKMNYCSTAIQKNETFITISIAHSALKSFFSNEKNKYIVFLPKF